MTSGLVLVAHPDDELLFAGAALLARPDIDWKIICATYTDADPRGYQFNRGIEQLRELGGGAIEGRMLGLPDDGWPPTHSWYEQLLEKAEAATHETIIDFVLTHGVRGEYGHPHHCTVNSIAHHLFPPERVWEFRYPGRTGAGPQVLRSHVHGVPVTSMKHAMFDTIYGSELPGLRYHMPELIAYELQHGPELYTGDGVWPL